MGGIASIVSAGLPVFNAVTGYTRAQDTQDLRERQAEANLQMQQARLEQQQRQHAETLAAQQQREATRAAEAQQREAARETAAQQREAAREAAAQQRELAAQQREAARQAEQQRREAEQAAAEQQRHHDELVHLRESQDQEMTQLRQTHQTTLDNDAAAARIQAQQVAQNAAVEEQRRLDALRRAVARTKVALGGRGVDSNDGSGEAILLGQIRQSDQERQNANAATVLRVQEINQQLDARYRRNLLDQTQLAERQRLQYLSRT